MRTKTVFTEVEALLCRDEFRYVSPLALEIHVRAVARCVRGANPAFIADTGLDAIAPGPVTTLAAAELCLAGVWHRAGSGYGGYVISDDQLIDHLAEAPLLRGLKAACRRWWRELNSERFIPL
ncbi:hypothetical protein [Mycolicibacterium arenosum]|uniref:Uncharacterized protein n=1 Tax=Mycolicibacterium arenosum TaxID=2952157 RepID=A0ABT1M914_9MYCO|nr:hypothetical protein [Mycolicibacterium sp. CAU 1645]MCP9274709.1 hypothetical protein [Mycolicibacterium sp. CAU 1645]